MSRRRTDRLAAEGRPHGGALRAFLALAVAGGLLVSACGGSDAGSPPEEPAQPTRGAPPPVSETSSGSEPRPAVVTPVTGRRERVVPWKLVASRDGGRRLELEVTLGGPPCDALTAVTVRETRSTVTITVHAGRVPKARCGPGVEAAVGTFHVVADLREPLAERRLRHRPRRA